MLNYILILVAAKRHAPCSRGKSHGRLQQELRQRRQLQVVPQRQQPPQRRLDLQLRPAALRLLAADAPAEAEFRPVHRRDPVRPRPQEHVARRQEEEAQVALLPGPHHPSFWRGGAGYRHI